MDKYEFNTRIEQIKKAVLKKDFKTATRTADMIDWAKVKNNSILLLVADAYEADRQYEKAKEVLLIAYKRAPMGRQLAYRLSILSVKMKDFVDAEEFYMDFTQIAPSDTAAYILKYRIAKGRGESPEALIRILEAYNEVDMEEKWAYCLAKLYDKIGDKEKCVSLCDEISLWFNEGIYVTKALKLKQKYTPLTKGQAERLEISATKTFEPIKNEFDDEPEEEIKQETGDTKVVPELQEQGYPEIKVKEFSGNGSDTIDIQETIAKSMEVLMNDEESSQDEVADSDDKNKEGQKKLGNTNSILNPIYKMEGDGQISLDVEEDEEKTEKQITGQLDIESVLKDLENRGILNKHTVSSTVDAMDKAASVVEQAKIETEEYLSIRRTSSLIDTIEKISDEEDIDEIIDESDSEDEHEEELVIDDIIEVSAEEPEDDDITEEPAEEPEDDDITEEPVEEPEDNDIIEVSAKDDDFDTPARINTADLNDIAEALEHITEKVEDEAAETEAAETKLKISEKDMEDKIEVFERTHRDKTRLSAEDAEIFSSFLTITGLEEKLVNTIASLTNTEEMDGTSKKNNIIIMGDGKSGKTTLAIELIKLINKKRGRTGRRIAKVNAAALNNRGFANSFNKLLKCDLIIEDAAKLDEYIVDEIIEAGNYYTDDMIILMEDLSSNMKSFIADYPDMDNMFGNKLILKEFSLKEWLDYAEKYAEKQGYEIDSVGKLALAQNIDEIYGINQGMEKEDVQEIIDNAIEKRKRKIGRKFARIFSGKNDELELEVLKEKDFM